LKIALEATGQVRALKSHNALKKAFMAAGNKLTNNKIITLNWAITA
jgi:hypothetical protein